MSSSNPVKRLRGRPPVYGSQKWIEKNGVDHRVKVKSIRKPTKKIKTNKPSTLKILSTSEDHPILNNKRKLDDDDGGEVSDDSDYSVSEYSSSEVFFSSLKLLKSS
jgi:hypothetical protein